MTSTATLASAPAPAPTARKPVTLQGAEWAGLLKCASKESHRVNIHCVALYSDGTLCATNGWRLLMRLTSDAAPAADRGTPICIGYADAKRIAKLAGTRAEVTLSPADGADVNAGVHVSVDGVGFTVAPVDCSFPPVQHVTCTPTPAPEEGFRSDEPATFGVSAALVADTFGTLAKVHAAADLPVVQVRAWGPLAPIHVTCKGHSADYFAIIMPCRI